MPDVIDDAPHAEALDRAAALSQAACRRQGPGPEWIDGVACCRDCGEPIPAARLLAMPGCGRCRECQEAADG